MSFMTAELSSQIPTVLIMLSIICVVGTVGNLLVIIVYALKHDRLTSTLFILVLAVADFLACLTLIPGTIAIEYLEWKIRSSFLCKSYYLLNNSFIPFSSLLISCIAFDRYFCLCHPFSKIMTFVRAKRIIGVLVFACLFQGGCSTFLVRIEKVKSAPANIFHQSENDTRLEMSASMNGTLNDTYECTEVIRVNVTMLEYVWYRVTQKIQIVSYVFCILSVTVLYILIYSSVSKVFKKRKQLISRHMKSPTTRIENYLNSPREPEIVHVNRVQCKNDQTLTVRNQTLPADLNRSDCSKSTTKSRTNSTGSNNHIILSHTGPCATPELFPERDKPVVLPPAENSEKDKLASDVARNMEEAETKVSQKSSRKLSSESVMPQIQILAEPASGGFPTPVDPENRSCVFNGERSKLSVRHLTDSVTFQNLKTAAMLFVVAIVYIVAFLPAMLMANELITLYLPVFYLYYVNNAINPIVYGFMNPNFRADIRKLFVQKCRCT
ncbi:Neuropeptide FF receptor 1 [Fasciola hepatica]|uniref:Neuropeptide FF receptor 1 n=1 Tax=Fasciola hepatica TaxID=6192 RepID=A0A2H1CH25_FASHE|nr:Neuropeptide FF receptor 1 [Fasciola hepatica]